MATEVYLLEHEMTYADGYNAKVIGVFSSRAEAKAAIKRLERVQGFSDPRGKFTIDLYPINEVNWEEGFIPSE